MQDYVLTRQEVHEKIKELVSASQDKDLVKSGIELWLEENQAPEFVTRQVLNDLTSYQEYLNLLN